MSEKRAEGALDDKAVEALCSEGYANLVQEQPEDGEISLQGESSAVGATGAAGVTGAVQVTDAAWIDVVRQAREATVILLPVYLSDGKTQIGTAPFYTM